MPGEAEEKGVIHLNNAAELEGHICRLCDCPDHRACGCEAKAAAAAKTDSSKTHVLMHYVLQNPNESLTACGVSIVGAWVTGDTSRVNCPRCIQMLGDSYEKPALDAELPAEDIAKQFAKDFKKDNDKFQADLGKQLMESRDAMLAAQRDVVEYQGIIAEQLKIIAAQLTAFVTLFTKKINEDIANGGPYGN